MQQHGTDPIPVRWMAPEVCLAYCARGVLFFNDGSIRGTFPGFLFRPLSSSHLQMMPVSYTTHFLSAK